MREISIEFFRRIAEKTFENRILFLFHLLNRSIFPSFFRISSDIFSSIFETRVSPLIYSVPIRPIAGINFLKNKPIMIEVNEPRKARSSSRILFSLFSPRSQFQVALHAIIRAPSSKRKPSRWIFEYSFFNSNRLEKRRDSFGEDMLFASRVKVKRGSGLWRKGTKRVD